MKASRVALRVVVTGVGLLLLVASVSFASFRAGFNARCKVGDMTGVLRQYEVQTTHEAGFGWTRRAVMCSMGDYQVATQSEPGQRADLFIIRKARLFILVNDRETDLMDDSGQHILFSMTR